MPECIYAAVIIAKMILGTIFIIINIFYSLIHLMIICETIKIHCNRLLQVHDLHGVFTRPRCCRRPHSVATALPQLAV